MLRKAQILGTNFGQLRTYPQSSQGKGWIGATDQHQLQIGRTIFQQVIERLMDHHRIDQVVIIKNQRQRLAKCHNVIDQA